MTKKFKITVQIDNKYIVEYLNRDSWVSYGVQYANVLLYSQCCRKAPMERNFFQ